MSAASFGIADYVLFVCSLGSFTAIGAYFACRGQKNARDALMATDR
jgi:hypothetical protein